MDDMVRLELLLGWSLDRLDGLEELAEFLLAREEDHEQYLSELQERILALEGPRRGDAARRL